MKKNTLKSVSNGTRNGSRSNPRELSQDEFMKRLVTALDAVRDGDFTETLPSNWTGLEGKVADSLNNIANRMSRFNTSLLRLRRQVGEEGKIGERLAVGDAVGSWAERVEAINSLVDDLSQP